MRKISIVLIALFMSACANQTILINPQYTSNQATYEETQRFLFWGFGTVEKKLQPIEICGSVGELIRIERSYLPLDAFFTVITLGIYMPQTVRIYCRK